MQTPENMATGLVETIAKRATRGGLFDFNIAYAACLEVILAYGDARAAQERERCARLMCKWCAQGLARSSNGEHWVRYEQTQSVQGRWYSCAAMKIWDADPLGA